MIKLEENKRQYWLIGNGYNINFAEKGNKDWMNFILNLSLVTEENYVYFLNDLFKNNDFGTGEDDDLNKFITYQLILIFKKIFIEIKKQSKNNRIYYEALMEKVLDGSFVEFTNLWEYGKNVKVDAGILDIENTIGLLFINNLFTIKNSLFKIQNNSLTIKLNFTNNVEKNNFLQRYQTNIEAKGEEISIVLNNIKKKFKIFYLYGIEKWIHEVKDNTSLAIYKNKCSDNVFQFFKKNKNMIGNSIIYTTNYYDAIWTRFNFGGKDRVYNIGPNEYLVFPSEKAGNIKLMKQPKEYINIKKELNIFGLNPNCDCELIDQIIKENNITDIRFWYHVDKREGIEIARLNAEIDFEAAWKEYDNSEKSNISNLNVLYNNANEIWEGKA